MNSDQCLNCGESINNRFCPGCGQKAATHRITVPHFITHDLVHGVWHLDRGILFTIKEAIIRPGQAALDYISGKRIRYYNVFYLCLLLIGLNALLIHFIRPYRPVEYLNQEGNSLFGFLSTHAKLLVFAIVPVLAINAKIFFRRLKLNFAEHFIVAGMCLIGIIISSIIWYFFDFGGEAFSSDFLGIFEVALILILLLFPVWTYWNVTRSFYSRAGRAWRVAVFYMVLLLELIVTLVVINYAVTGSFSIKMIV